MAESAVLEAVLSKSLDAVLKRLEKGERLKPEDYAALILTLARDYGRQITEIHNRITQLTEIFVKQTTEISQLINNLTATLRTEYSRDKQKSRLSNK
ncbi:MAG: hypothetical protein QW680_10725 [Pyrobaculum sp.]